MLAVAAIAVWQLVRAGAERHVIAWGVAAFFVCIAVPLSLHDMRGHLRHFVSPLQRQYIRIMLLVPIYAIDAWLALRFKEQKVYINTAREAYEAFTIFSFYSLLEEFLGPPEHVGQLLSERGARTGHAAVHMLPPFCCLRPWPLDASFVRATRRGTLQYVVVRVLLSLAIFVAELYDLYGEGQFLAFGKLYVYKVVLMNVSQVVAMWSLVMLYHETREELAPLAPLTKLLAVKAIVFLSFWQVSADSCGAMRSPPSLSLTHL